MTSLPSLVLLDSVTGRVISKNGRDLLLQDPGGRNFPWRPRPITQVFAGVSLVDPEGKSVDYQDLKDGYKAIYFSAHWVSKVL